MTVSTTSIVFTRYILLEWIRREDTDPRTMGDLFFLVYDEVKDIELSDALQRLLTIFADGLRNSEITVSESVRLLLIDWFLSQPKFIRALFPAFIAESRLMISEQATQQIPCQ